MPAARMEAPSAITHEPWAETEVTLRPAHGRNDPILEAIAYENRPGRR